MAINLPDEAPVHAELEREHADRITEAEHEAEQAAEQAQDASQRLEQIASELGSKADVGHEHPIYVRHDELDGKLSSLREELSRTATAAEDAADAALDAAEQPGPAGDGVDELPLPEPQEPEYRYERRHGRTRRMRQ